MSLDVYLIGKTTEEPCQSQFYCQDCDQAHTFEHTRKVTEQFFDANITHNLGKMAEEAGIYTHLWHPENLPNQPVKAKDLIEPVAAGLALMKADPNRFKKHNAPNGWGLYEHFIPWIERYLAALREFPEADVHTST